MLRRVILAGLSTCLLTLTFGLTQAAFAQDRCKDACWIDAKTGKSVRTVPISGSNIGGSADAGVAVLDLGDANAKRAFNARTGANYFKRADGAWIDSKTGRCVRTVPISGSNIGGSADAGVAVLDLGDANAKRAFNARTGANYVQVPCPPPQTATTTPPLGGVRVATLGTVTYPVTGPFAFTFGIGPSWARYSSNYSSTGTQAPGSFSSTRTGADICGGVSMYWPMGASSRFQYGGGLNICGDTGGSTNLFDIVRHPGNGHVVADVKPGARLEPFIGVHMDLNNGPKRDFVPDHALFRMGPVFARNKLSISSDQTGAGGRLETASNSIWTTGFGVTAGLSTPLCPRCVFGAPLTLNLLAKGAWFPSSKSVSVPSSAFGFTETASLDRSSQYGLQMNFSVPLNYR